MSTYINIKSEWLTEWRLTPAEAVVYGYLYGWLVERKDKSVPFRQTQTEMAEAIGMNERTFKGIIGRLEEWGCVKINRKGNKTTYTLARMLYRESAKSAPSEEFAPSAKSAPSECKNCTEVSAKSAPNTLYNTSYNTPCIIKPENFVSGGEEEEKKDEPKGKAKAPHQAKASRYTFEEQRLHGDLKRIYDEEWKAAHGEPFYWSPAAMAALVKIKKQIVFLMPESDKDNAEAVKDNFRIFVHLTLTTDGWYRANGTPQVIASKFNELYTQLKNGNNSSSGNRHQPQYSAEFMAELAADLASGR